jgi:hypothetical protein
MIVFNGSLHVYHYLDPVTHNYYIKVQWERKGCQADQQHVARFSIFFQRQLLCVTSSWPSNTTVVPVSVPSRFYFCAQLVCVLFS